MGLADLFFGKKQTQQPTGLLALSNFGQGPTKQEIEDKTLDTISFLESSSDTNPKRLTKNSSGALGEFQLTEKLLIDIKRDFPEHKNVTFKEAALGSNRREFARLGLESTSRNLSGLGVAPTRDAVIQAYHSGAGNVANNNIGPEGRDYLSKFNELIGK